MSNCSIFFLKEKSTTWRPNFDVSQAFMRRFCPTVGKNNITIQILCENKPRNLSGQKNNQATCWAKKKNHATSRAKKTIKQPGGPKKKFPQPLGPKRKIRQPLGPKKKSRKLSGQNKIMLPLGPTKNRTTSWAKKKSCNLLGQK